MELYEAYLRHPHISTDSRQATQGTLFFALRGDSFDGNRYAASALEAGAAAAVLDNPEVYETLTEEQRSRCYLVPDTLEALQQLAVYHRRQLGIPIFAITGSNGKTTTKELTYRVLSCRFHTYATHGNLNNHIGVPLTLLSMDRSTEFGLVEMGASHCGEIALLSSIAQPDFGLITNIGKAHLEGFGGEEGVMRGKGELLDYLLRHKGTAFYLQQSEALCRMVSERNGLEAIPYSTTDLKLVGNDRQFLTVSWRGHKIRTHLVGEYNLFNLAAAIAVGTYFDIPEPEIVAAIESYHPENNRSQRQATPHNTLILDAYNANPSSMEAALRHFISEPSMLPKAVILGDMLELGSYSAQEHRKIVELLQEARIEEVFLVGRHFTEAGADCYPTFPDTDALRTYLTGHPIANRLILIKGSRGIHLERLTELL